MVTIRPRTGADVDACVAIAEAVHDLDGYPVYLPTSLREFLVSAEAYGAWVAEDGGHVVGHVALHKRSTDAVIGLASTALGRPAHRLAVVARLLVAPGVRRAGIGRSLLDVAAREAATRGLYPILDVVAQHVAAVALYESCGWIRAGTVTCPLGQGDVVEEHVYLGPPSHRSD
ncbi:MAG TPA: GNAT family N-acetyltransferase [Acidimicrobiales bacterium]